MRIFLAKNRHQHIGTSDLFFAIAGGLHMHDGALNDSLKTQRGLGVYFVSASDLRCVVLDEVRQGFAQIIDIGRAGTQHFGGAGVVEQCQQQMLDGDEFMTLLPGFYEGHVQADFKFLGNHDFFLGAILGSTVYGNGWDLFNGFSQTLQRMPCLVGSVLHLVHFCGSDILGVNPANTFAVQMDFEHDLCGSFPVFAEKLLQNTYDKLHGREVIVQHDHLVHLWRLGFERFALQNNGISSVAVSGGCDAGRFGGSRHGFILSMSTSRGNVRLKLSICSIIKS